MFDFASSTSSAADRLLDALVVVVHRDREHLLGAFLANHVLVENRFDLARPRNAQLGVLLLFAVNLFGDDVVAQPDALVADVDGGPGDELLHFFLRFSAERSSTGSDCRLFAPTFLVAMSLALNAKRGL